MISKARVRIVLAGVLLSCFASGAMAMTYDEALALLRAGVGSDVVLAQLKEEGGQFDLSSAQVLELREAGANDTLLRAMIDADSRDAGKSSEISVNDDDDEGDYDVNVYVDPFGYRLYSWPTAFAYYCPSPGWNFSFYYGGYRGWRWADYDWCNWGSWYWPGRSYCGSPWYAWGASHSGGRHHSYADSHRDGWTRSSSGKGRFGDRTWSGDRNRSSVPHATGTVHSAPTRTRETVRSTDRFRSSPRSWSRGDAARSRTPRDDRSVQPPRREARSHDSRGSEPRTSSPSRHRGR